MADKYLNYSGLSQFLDKLKTFFIQGVQVNGNDLTPSNAGKVNVLIQESTNNGKIKVNNVDVDIHGLGSAAYTASTAYDAAGTAAAAVASLTIPTDTNDLTNGAGFQTSSDVSSAISTELGKLDSSASAASNKALASITITDGKITASTDITVPTNNNQLTNGAGYQTASDVTTAINSAIGGITGIDFQVVTDYQHLPATGTKGVIYLVPNSGTAPNVYDEYIWVTNSGTSSYEKIGSTAVDLSGYWAKADLVAITSAEIDALFTSAA